VWSITAGAVAVQDCDGSTDAGQALVWGTGLAGSGPDGPWCGLIDLPGSPDGKAGGRLAAALARPRHGEGIAVRPYGTFARRLVPGWPERGPRPAPWHPGDTVLVMNGADGIGVCVARWLAARGVQVSMAHGAGTDRAALARLISEASAVRPLTAVIHTSAVAAWQLPAHARTEQLEQAVREKITEIGNLDDLTRDLDLTAFVVIAPYIPPGAPGGVYAEAVRSFAGALGQARRMRGQPASVVAVGVTCADLGDEEVGQILQASASDLVITDARWADVARRTSHPLVNGLAERGDATASAAGPDDADQAGTDDLPRRLLQASGRQRERLMTELVRRQLALALGHENAAEVADDANFHDLGLSSLMALKLHQKITAASGIDFPVLAVIDHSTPTALAQYLANVLTGAADPQA
jgi:hypothetical protein